MTARLPYTAAVPLIRAIYSRSDGITGCCLHVVLDDGNWDCLDWCLAQEGICDECRACAGVLASMSMTARRKALRVARCMDQCERLDSVAAEFYASTPPSDLETSHKER